MNGCGRVLGETISNAAIVCGEPSAEVIKEYGGDWVQARCMECVADLEAELELETQGRKQFEDLFNTRIDEIKELEAERDKFKEYVRQDGLIQEENEKERDSLNSTVAYYADKCRKLESENAELVAREKVLWEGWHAFCYESSNWRSCGLSDRSCCHPDNKTHRCDKDSCPTLMIALLSKLNYRWPRRVKGDE